MSENPYKKLEEALAQVSWPSVYMFKFIIPSDNHKIAQVEALFGSEAIIQLKESGKGNYVSITVKELMLTAESVIEKYQEAGKIPGLMAF